MSQPSKQVSPTQAGSGNEATGEWLWSVASAQVRVPKPRPGSPRHCAWQHRVMYSCVPPLTAPSPGRPHLGHRHLQMSGAEGFMFALMTASEGHQNYHNFLSRNFLQNAAGWGAWYQAFWLVPHKSGLSPQKHMPHRRLEWQEMKVSISSQG